MSRPILSLIALLFFSGCVTNAQPINPDQTPSKSSSNYTAMTVEGTGIYYRDLTKALPSAYRSAARSAPLHHPERKARIEHASRKPAGTTITITHFPQRSLSTKPPKATRLYLKKDRDKSAVFEPGRRS